MVGMKIDDRELREAMLLYAKATKKDETYIVNRTARNFAIKVIVRTPKAAPEKIEGELKALPERTFLGVMFKRMYSGSKQGAKVMSIFKGNLDKGSRQALAMAAVKFIAQRRATAGYIRRGWYKIANVFGAGSAVHADRGRSGGRAVKQSTAKKANDTMSLVAAEFENMAEGSSEVAWQATQDALNAAAADMTAYAYSVMDGTAKKYSAKK